MEWKKGKNNLGFEPGFKRKFNKRLKNYFRDLIFTDNYWKIFKIVNDFFLGFEPYKKYFF